MEFNQAFDPVRALKTSWTAIRAAPLPLIVGGSLLVITGSGGGGNLNFGGRGVDRDLERMWPILAGMLLLACCLGIAFFLISSWIQVGFANTVEEVLRTGKGDIGTVFDGKGRLLSMVLGRILGGLIVLASALPFAVVALVAVFLHERAHLREGAAILLGIGGCLAWLPVVFYVGLGLALLPQAVALEGCSPTQAVSRSWSLAGGHRWMLLWYFIVTGLFTLIGICACCAGILLTGTMANVATTDAYLAWTRGSERPGWWIETREHPTAPAPVEGWGSPPPPPTAAS